MRIKEKRKNLSKLFQYYYKLFSTDEDQLEKNVNHL